MSKTIKRRYFTARQRQAITNKFEGVCQACGKEGLSPLSDEDKYLASMDHIIPLSRGGSNDDDNVQLLCLPCNLSKGQMTMGEFVDYLKCNEELNVFASYLENVKGVSPETISIAREKTPSKVLHNVLKPLFDDIELTEVMSND